MNRGDTGAFGGGSEPGWGVRPTARLGRREQKLGELG